MKKTIINWLMKSGDALSQLVNAVFLNGNPNESISGRAWRTRSIWYKVIDALLWFDKDHCKNSYNNDIAYAISILK